MRHGEGERVPFFGGPLFLAGFPPGAMTAAEGGGFVSVSVCVRRGRGSHPDRFFCKKRGEGGGAHVGEGRFCGSVRSVGDGVSRRRRGVIVPAPFCLHTLLLLNGRIKEYGRVLIFELRRHRCTNTRGLNRVRQGRVPRSFSLSVCVCVAKCWRLHRRP